MKQGLCGRGRQVGWLIKVACLVPEVFDVLILLVWCLMLNFVAYIHLLVA
jgi:hypothetical protein